MQYTPLINTFLLDQMMRSNVSYSQSPHSLYLTDVIGTTTPAEFTSGPVIEYMLNDAQDEISKITGHTPKKIREIVENGQKQSKEGNKEHPDFKEYIKIQTDFILGKSLSEKKERP